MPGFKKLNNKVIGPYKVLKQIKPVTYKLLLPRHLRTHPTFHVSLRKHFVPGPLDQNQLPEHRIINNQLVYTINKILKSRKKGKDIEYHIDWERYGSEKHSSKSLLKQVFHKEYTIYTLLLPTIIAQHDPCSFMCIRAKPLYSHVWYLLFMNLFCFLASAFWIILWYTCEYCSACFTTLLLD